MRKITYKENVSEDLKKMVIPSFDKTVSRNSLGLENHVGEFFYISINDLVPFKNQARKYFDEEELNALADSIKEHGIRQPLTVLPIEGEKGKYEIVSGERRLRAAKSVGLDKVPCILIHDRNKAEEIAIIENIHREDLHPIELANAYKSLLESGFGLNQLDLAKKISVKNYDISTHLKYCELPEWVQSYLINNNIRSREILRKLVKNVLDNQKLEQMLGITKKATHTNFSVIRIGYKEGNYLIQDRGINKLSSDEKKKLKKELDKILKKLS